MNLADTVSLEPDLALCAKEPIHIPGAIQPHGALLAVLADESANGWKVARASANLGDFLGQSAEAVLGQPLAEVLGDAARREILEAEPRYGPAIGLSARIPGLYGAALALQFHRSGRYICIDIEALRHERWKRQRLTRLQSVVESFTAARSRRDLCALAVQGLKSITGYDRVMAYRFGADGHGEVIAEAVRSGITPCLGQHYPATDIPLQARLQYLRQRVGTIADAAYRPVPLVVWPAVDDPEPLDLTYSALRSVSPVHRQYMANMNTAASLTVGLADGAKLWGMLVCHHATPRIAGPELRAVVDMIGHVVSLLVGGLGTAEVSNRRLERAETLRALLERLSAAEPLDETLAALQVELLHLVGATGAFVSYSGKSLCLGRTPPFAASRRALEVLHQSSDGEVLAVDDLGLRHPELAGCTQEGSGALMMPLGQTPGDAILWFRPELARAVMWGGNPTGGVNADPQTGQISPRASFEAWKQLVSGHSTPWDEADLQLARELRHAIDTELARRTKVAHDQFARLFEVSPTALALTGRSGSIKMVNQRTEQMFGYDRGEMQGQPFAMLFPERLRGVVDKQRDRCIVGMSSRLVMESPMLFGQRKDGHEFPIEIGLNPITLGGEPMLLADLSDMTRQRQIEHERQQRQRELERSNADLEEFSQAVSHDLKAPLRAIGHLAQWIGEDSKVTADAGTFENLRLLQGRVVRMQKLLDGLLEYSRVGHTGTAAEDVDIPELVSDITAMLDLPPAFVVACEGEWRPLRTERVALQMVLENLIGNGVKHHDRAEGRITVRMQVAGGMAEFRVSDDGPGIEERFHQRIFMVFQTLKSRDDLEASGIGLAIVKRKVENHSGRIWVESAPPARGATFIFTWKETAR